MEIEGLTFRYGDSGTEEMIYAIDGIDDFYVEVDHNKKQFCIRIGDYYGMFYRIHYEKLVSVVTQLEAHGYTFQKEYIHGER